MEVTDSELNELIEWADGHGWALVKLALKELRQRRSSDRKREQNENEARLMRVPD